MAKHMDYAFPGLGATLADAAREYAKMHPRVTHEIARTWLAEARAAKKEPNRSRRARLVAERVQVARMMARAARIAAR